MNTPQRCLAVACVFLCLAFCNANAYKNSHTRWALHYAGPFDSKAQTCDFTLEDCYLNLAVDAPAGPGRFGVYVIAADVHGIAGVRYGLHCDEQFYFYGWTKCSEFEIPTGGWPGCDEGNAQTWSEEQLGPHVTMGILDVYVYAGVNKLYAWDDPRVGYTEACDATQPSAVCWQRSVEGGWEDAFYFGIVGFGTQGHNPCGLIDPTQQNTWGLVKALYRR